MALPADEGKPVDPSASQESKEQGGKELSGITAGTGMDDTRSASELASRGRDIGPTAAAFTAATQLVEACVANLAMPQLDDIIQVDLQILCQSLACNIFETHTTRPSCTPNLPLIAVV